MGYIATWQVSCMKPARVYLIFDALIKKMYMLFNYTGISAVDFDQNDETSTIFDKKFSKTICFYLT